MSDADERPTPLEVVSKINEIRAKKVTKIVEKAKKKTKIKRGETQIPQEELASIEAQAILESADEECRLWPVAVAAEYMWEEFKAYTKKHGGTRPETWEQLLNEKGYDGPSRSYVISNFGEFKRFIGALESDYKKIMAMLQGDSPVFAPEEPFAPVPNCPPQQGRDNDETRPDSRWDQMTKPYSGNIASQALLRSGFAEPMAEDVPDSLDSAVNSVLNGQIVQENISAVMERPVKVEDIGEEEELMQIEDKDILPLPLPDGSFEDEAVLEIKEVDGEDVVSLDYGAYKVTAADEPEEIPDAKDDAGFIPLKQRKEGITTDLPPAGGEETLVRIFEGADLADMDAASRPIDQDFEETATEMPALTPKGQPVPDLSANEPPVPLGNTVGPAEGGTALTRNGIKRKVESGRIVVDLSEPDKPDHETGECTGVVQRNGYSNGKNGLKKEKESGSTESTDKQAIRYVPPGERAVEDEDRPADHVFGYAGGSGGGGGSYDDSSGKRRFGIFALIATSIVAGAIGLYALFSDTKDRGAGQDEVPAKVHKQERSSVFPDFNELFKRYKGHHQVKESFDSAAWEDACKNATLDDVVQLVRDDHPLSRNPDYNLSPDGKVNISNQNVINTAYWYGTRKFGKSRGDWWRGGYGTQRQKEMATEWLAQYGIDIEDLIANRSTEFDGSLIQAEMVYGSVVEECRVSQDGGDIETTPDLPDVEEYEKENPDKGAMNILHESFFKIFKTSKTKIAYKEEAKLEDTSLRSDGPAAVETDDDICLEVELAPESFVPEDREAIADMFAEAYFNKGSDFNVRDIGKFYAGVTPELAAQIYAEQKINNPEYDDDYITITESGPITEIECLIKEIDDAILEFNSPEHRQKLDSHASSLESLEKEIKDAEKKLEELEKMMCYESLQSQETDVREAA